MQGSKHVRVTMLKAFLVRNRHKTGPQLEKEFGNGALIFVIHVLCVLVDVFYPSEISNDSQI